MSFDETRPLDQVRPVASGATGDGALGEGTGSAGQRPPHPLPPDRASLIPARYAMSLRLPREQADALEVIARANGRTVAAELRLALASFIDGRKADPDFARKARAKADEWARFADSCGAA